MGSIPIARAIYASSPVEKAERYERSDEGSIPSSRAIHAVLAHLVERDLAKVEATGSNPVYCSTK